MEKSIAFSAPVQNSGKKRLGNEITGIHPGGQKSSPELGSKTWHKIRTISLGTITEPIASPPSGSDLGRTKMGFEDENKICRVEVLWRRTNPDSM